MRIYFIKERVREYDQEKGALRYLAGGVKAIKFLRELAKENDDRELTEQELFRFYSEITEAFSKIKDVSEPEAGLLNAVTRTSIYLIVRRLEDARPSLFNKENFSEILNHQEEYLWKIVKVWDVIPDKALQCQGVFEILLEHKDYLEDLYKVLSSTHTTLRQPYLAHPIQDYFMRVCFLSLMPEGIAEGIEVQPLIMNFEPKQLLSRANLKAFREFYVAKKINRGDELTDFDKGWAKDGRLDIIESMNRLPNSLKTAKVFRLLCTGGESKKISFVREFLTTLPEHLKTYESLQQALSTRHPTAVLHAMQGLSREFQTKENYKLIIDTVISSDTFDCFRVVYEKWHALPASLKTQENFETFHTNNIRNTRYMLYDLALYFDSFPVELKTQDNFKKLFGTKMTNRVSAIFKELFTPQMFTAMTFKDKYFEDEARLLRELANVMTVLPDTLKTLENIKLLLDHDSPNATACRSVHILFSALPQELRTQENLLTIVENPISIYVDLLKERDVRQAFRVKGRYLDRTLLEIGPFLNQAQLELILRFYKEPNECRAEMIRLGTELSVVKAVFNQFIHSRHTTLPWSQDHFNLLSHHAQQLLQFEAFEGDENGWQRVQNIINRMPPHLITLEFLNQFVALIVRIDMNVAMDIRNPRHPVYIILDRLEHHVNGIINQHNQIAEHRRRGDVFNPSQSTHTASVHRSVSESAAKLKRRYGDQINTLSKLEGIILEIRRWSEGAVAAEIGVNPFHLAKAKSALDRLTDPFFAYTDRNSGISMREALALVWIAIHDSALCTAPLNIAISRWVTGLYDIQRGYNQTDTFEDDMSSNDHAICTAGTFNKIVEIPWGIHPDVNLHYVTRKQASEKFPKLVAELVSDDLRELGKKAVTPEEISHYNALVNKIDQKGIESIWNTIKPVVCDRMFEEFGEVYKGRDDPEFIALIDQGQWVDLSQVKLRTYTKSEMSPEEKKEEDYSPPPSPHSFFQPKSSVKSDKAIIFPKGTTDVTEQIYQLYRSSIQEAVVKGIVEFLMLEREKCVKENYTDKYEKFVNAIIQDGISEDTWETYFIPMIAKHLWNDYAEFKNFFVGNSTHSQFVKILEAATQEDISQIDFRKFQLNASEMGSSNMPNIKPSS